MLSLLSAHQRVQTKVCALGSCCSVSPAPCGAHTGGARGGTWISFVKFTFPFSFTHQVAGWLKAEWQQVSSAAGGQGGEEQLEKTTQGLFGGFFSQAHWEWGAGVNQSGEMNNL